MPKLHNKASSLNLSYQLKTETRSFLIKYMPKNRLFNVNDGMHGYS